MKLLLVEDVEVLGWLGDIVEVKNGYARNYLVPQGLAVVPTQKAIDALADEKARRAESRKLEYEQKEQLASSIEGAEVVLAAKANELGHLFGSVAERDIAENLRQQGLEVPVDKEKFAGCLSFRQQSKTPTVLILCASSKIDQDLLFYPV